jgi:hypothetical protein
MRLWTAFVASVVTAIAFCAPLTASAQALPVGGVDTPAPVATSAPALPAANNPVSQALINAAQTSCVAKIGDSANSPVEGVLRDVSDPNHSAGTGSNMLDFFGAAGKYIWGIAAAFSIALLGRKWLLERGTFHDRFVSAEGKIFSVSMTFIALQFATSTGMFANAGMGNHGAVAWAAGLAQKFASAASSSIGVAGSGTATPSKQYVVQNAGDAFAVGLCMATKESIVTALSGVSRASTDIVNNTTTGSVTDRAMGVLTAANEAMAGVNSSQTAILPGLVLWLLIVLLYAVIACQLFLIQWGAVVLGSVAVIFLGFAALEKTAAWAEGYWKFLFGNVVGTFTITFVTIFVTALLDQTELRIAAMVIAPPDKSLTVGGTALNTITAGFNTYGQSLATVGMTLFITFVCLVLVIAIPALTTSFTSGGAGVTAGNLLAAGGIMAGAIAAPAAAASKVGGLIKSLDALTKSMKASKNALSQGSDAAAGLASENALSADPGSVTPETASEPVAAPAHDGDVPRASKAVADAPASSKPHAPANAADGAATNASNDTAEHDDAAAADDAIANTAEDVQEEERELISVGAVASAATAAANGARAGRARTASPQSREYMTLDGRASTRGKNPPASAPERESRSTSSTSAGPQNHSSSNPVGRSSDSAGVDVPVSAIDQALSEAEAATIASRTTLPTAPGVDGVSEVTPELPGDASSIEDVARADAAPGTEAARLAAAARGAGSAPTSRNASKDQAAIARTILSAVNGVNAAAARGGAIAKHPATTVRPQDALREISSALATYADAVATTAPARAVPADAALANRAESDLGAQTLSSLDSNEPAAVDTASTVPGEAGARAGGRRGAALRGLAGDAMRPESTPGAESSAIVDAVSTSTAAQAAPRDAADTGAPPIAVNAQPKAASATSSSARASSFVEVPGAATQAGAPVVQGTPETTNVTVPAASATAATADGAAAPTASVTVAASGSRLPASSANSGASAPNVNVDVGAPSTFGTAANATAPGASRITLTRADSAGTVAARGGGSSTVPTASVSASGVAANASAAGARPSAQSPEIAVLTRGATAMSSLADALAQVDTGSSPHVATAVESALSSLSVASRSLVTGGATPQTAAAMHAASTTAIGALATAAQAGAPSAVTSRLRTAVDDLAVETVAAAAYAQSNGTGGSGAGGTRTRRIIRVSAPSAGGGAAQAPAASGAMSGGATSFAPAGVAPERESTRMNASEAANFEALFERAFKPHAEMTVRATTALTEAVQAMREAASPPNTPTPKTPRPSRASFYRDLMTRRTTAQQVLESALPDHHHSAPGLSPVRHG